MPIVNRRLNLCGSIEKETALIYRTLALLFPGENEVFKGLSVSEENHEKLVEKAKLAHKRRVLPPEFVPNSTLELEHALYHLKKTMKLLSGGLGLKEACDIALEIEDLTGEKYLQELIRGEIEIELDKEITGLLRRLSEAERAHAEIIRNFMASRNLLTL